MMLTCLCASVFVPCGVVVIAYHYALRQLHIELLEQRAHTLCACTGVFVFVLLSMCMCACVLVCVWVMAYNTHSNWAAAR